jgi:four helix bundle protein
MGNRGSNMASIESHRDLRVWQAAMDLTVAVYAASSNFPQAELYGLTSQMRRAATSVPSNIAEGYGRESTKSYVHFLKTARDSLNELETQLILSERLKLATTVQVAPLLEAINAIGKMLNALIRSLQDKFPDGFAED